MGVMLTVRQWRRLDMATLIAMIVLGMLAVSAHAAQPEKFYSDRICAEWGGKPTRLPSGIRPDCETEFAVVEFDWAVRQKAYECIGQAWAYARETGKTPVCALLYRNDDERIFADAIVEVINAAGAVVRILYADPNLGN